MSLIVELFRRAGVAFALSANAASATLRHKLEQFRNGLARRGGENFIVFLASAKTEKVIELKAPPFNYYADPFIRQIEGQAYLFCEQFSYLHNKGCLRCISLDKNLRPVASHVIPTGKGHASFPYLIDDAGVLYMIPETREEGGIHLYRCDRFPDKWKRIKTLVPNVDAVDTVAFQHDACWWLITSIVLAGYPDRRYLAVFSANGLIADDWQPHPVNRQMMYNALPYGSGRNAGAVVRSGGRLLRPAQHNLRYYGEAIDWMEITTLTKTDYTESLLPKTHPLVQVSMQFSMHHLSTSDDLVAWDIRDRVWSDKLNGELQAIRAMSASQGRELANVIVRLPVMPIRVEAKKPLVQRPE